MCQCKDTANAPFCDGTHTRLGEENIGDPVPKVSHDSLPKAEPTLQGPTVTRIHALAKDGLSKVGHHGELGVMGVPRKDLPHWDDIQILPAQFARKPLLEEAKVGTDIITGPRAKKPLKLNIPLFVSDMSFGSLSQEAKIALAKGAERKENSRYFYELASAGFGWGLQLMQKVQAFHFK